MASPVLSRPGHTDRSSNGLPDGHNELSGSVRSADAGTDQRSSGAHEFIGDVTPADFLSGTD